MAEDEVDKYIKKMEDDDTMFCEELDRVSEDLREAYEIDQSNLYREFMNTIGNMQRYNHLVAQKKFKKNKVRRYKIKLHAKLYDKYKFHSSIQIKTQHELETWISKDTNFARCDSYIYTIDALITFYEQAVKGLSQKVFALQSMIKAKDYETGPSF